MIAIIDYRAGNLTSVRLAFESLDIQAKITDSPAEILQAKRVVFPGVGAAGSAMRNLATLGLVDVIRAVIVKGTPFLGICLGTQILLERTEEDGGVDCLGFIRGTVRRFQPANRLDKVPQMGGIASPSASPTRSSRAYATTASSTSCTATTPPPPTVHASWANTLMRMPSFTPP